MNKFIEEYHFESQVYLLNAVPDIYDYKTLLYIGAAIRIRYPREMMFIPYFKEAGYSIDVLEAWPPNVANLRKMNTEGWMFPDGQIGPGLFDEIFQGDIRELAAGSEYCPKVKDGYDVILWHHGPEHVREMDVPPILKYMEETANKIACIGCPNGDMWTGPIYGNPLDSHTASFRLDFFRKLGWKAKTSAKGDTKSRIIAWKRTDEN